jgi:FkbM family methyltransferase
MNYSQIEQDLEVLKFYNNKTNGYYIEIGASDGINLSNTYLLEKCYNWKGICVEPIPDIYKLLCNNRPNSLCCDMVVYEESDKNINFDISYHNNLLSGISEKLNIHKDLVINDRKQIKIKTISFNDLLEKYNAPFFIDYLSLDTEGSELEILKSVNLKKYIFGFINVEHNFVEPTRTLIKELLITNGYDHIKENNFDDFYKHNSINYPSYFNIKNITDNKFTIVYKTYKNDLEWLNYSLLSLKKFLDTSNIFEIIIYTHDVVFTDVYNLIKKLDFLNYRVIPVHYNYHGYVKQMQIKLDCYKDVRTKYVIVLDSDLLLQKPLNFNSLIREDGKIEWKYLRIQDEPMNVNFKVWKKACEDATKVPKTIHYMSNGFPFIFTTESLKNGANNFKELHNVDYEAYCHKRCENENIKVEELTTNVFDKLSNVFTEFEYIGYYCHYFSDDYIFTPTPVCLMENQTKINNIIDSYFIQNWSYGGINDGILEKIKNILEI